MAYTNKLNVWANTSNNVEDSDTLASSSTPGKGAGLGFSQGDPIYSNTFNGILKEATLVTKALIDTLNDPDVTGYTAGSGNIDNTLSDTDLTSIIKNLILSRKFAGAEVSVLKVTNNQVFSLSGTTKLQIIPMPTKTLFNGVCEFADAVTFSDPTTFTGAETHSGSETHSGQVTYSEAVIYSNTETHGGSETHSGQETHNGIETHNGAMTINSSKPSAAGSSRKERLGSGSEGIVLTGQFIRGSNIERDVNLVDAIRNVTYINYAEGSDITYYGSNLNKNNIVEFLQERALRIEYRDTLGTSYPVVWFYNDILDKLSVRYLNSNGSYVELFDTSTSSTETINSYISELKYTYYVHYLDMIN